MELRSRVDGRYLPAQLRVRVHSRWRVMPSLSFCLWSLNTQFCVAGIGIKLFCGTPRQGSRASIRHHVERPNIVLSRNSDLVVFAQTRPRARVVFSGVFAFRAFLWDGNVHLYVLLFVCCLFVFSSGVCLMFFLCVRVSVFFYVRASLYLCLYLA